MNANLAIRTIAPITAFARIHLAPTPVPARKVTQEMARPVLVSKTRCECCCNIRRNEKRKVTSHNLFFVIRFVRQPTDLPNNILALWCYAISKILFENISFLSVFFKK